MAPAALGDPNDVYVVFNPGAGKGRGARLVEPVLRAFGGQVAHGLTERAGDEARLTREAIARGFRRIVAVGGDGTWSNVGNAILASGEPAALGLVSAGTGCDLAKSLDVPVDVAAAVEVVRQGATRTIDVGRIGGRYFLNIAGFGFDIAVLEHSRQVRWLGGSLLYIYCAVRQLFSYPGLAFEISTGEAAPQRKDAMMLIVANAKIFGGGFRIAPGADLQDGQLEAVTFSNMPWYRRLPIMVRLLQGTHLAAPEVSLSRAGRFRLRFAAPVAFETDGEWNPGESAEVEIEAVPGALRVLVPAR